MVENWLFWNKSDCSAHSLLRAGTVIMELAYVLEMTFNIEDTGLLSLVMKQC